MNTIISPLQFARALQQAIEYHITGMSQFEAITQACRTTGISDAWQPIIHLTLMASQTLAEDWCERIIKDALDTATEHNGEFR